MMGRPVLVPEKKAKTCVAWADGRYCCLLSRWERRGWGDNKFRLFYRTRVYSCSHESSSSLLLLLVLLPLLLMCFLDLVGRLDWLPCHSPAVLMVRARVTRSLIEVVVSYSIYAYSIYLHGGHGEETSSLIRRRCRTANTVYSSAQQLPRRWKSGYASQVAFVTSYCRMERGLIPYENGDRYSYDRGRMSSWGWVWLRVWPLKIRGVVGRGRDHFLVTCQG